MKKVHERYLKGLTAIYEDSQLNDGTISNVSMYSSTYNVSQSLGTVMQKLGYMTKEGNGRYATYTCRMRKPDQTMVIEVLDTLKEYSNGQYKPKASNVIPVSEYKRKIQKEVTSVMKDKIQSDVTDMMIRSVYAAKIIGVDLLSLPKEKINAFIKALS